MQASPWFYRALRYRRVPFPSCRAYLGLFKLVYLQSTLKTFPACFHRTQSNSASPRSHLFKAGSKLDDPRCVCLHHLGDSFIFSFWILTHPFPISFYFLIFYSFFFCTFSVQPCNKTWYTRNLFSQT